MKQTVRKCVQALFALSGLWTWGGCTAGESTSLTSSDDGGAVLPGLDAAAAADAAAAMAGGDVASAMDAGAVPARDAGPVQEHADAGPLVAGCPVFPPDNPWNTDVSEYPVRADSEQLVASIGLDRNLHPDFGTEWQGVPNGIPFVVVDGQQPAVPIHFQAYGDESDPGPYPVPVDAPIEGGPQGDGDRHVIVVDRAACVLYELYRAFPQPDGSWEADSGAVFALDENDEHPLSWTSADAAGLPIFPGLARYEEVVGERALRHALRVTVSRTRRAIIAPARHFASNDDDPALPPMGLRLRLQADYDCTAFSDVAQVICAGLKRYGLIVADNGSDWYLSGAPDPRWDDDALADLKQIPGAAFEAVDTGPAEVY